MKNTYTQLSGAERNQIYRFRQQGLSLREVGRRMFRSPSTISREWRRNRHPGHLYIPRTAHAIAKRRRSERPYQSKFSGNEIALVRKKIKQQWSPEQISGRLKSENGIKISHEWIYQWVIKDKKSGGALYKNLRQGHRKKRKRYAVSREKSGAIRNEKSIENRPKTVDLRERLGDWEGDTIIGAKHKQAIVSLVERKSLYTKLRKVSQKTAQKVRLAVIQAMNATRGPKLTLTFDRGSEFAEHEKIENKTGLDIYFAHPYSSFERGTNENTNGLVRQYLPKKSSFELVTNKDLKKIENRLNNRPRKKLGYKTPLEVYIQQTPLLASA